MTNHSRPMPPPAAWRWLGLAAVALLVGAVAAIGLISAGVFDPQPAGALRARQSLQAEKIQARGTYQTWSEEVLPPDEAYTLRLTAAYSAGETDVGYGLLLGQPGRHLAAAVSPAGYVAVWQREENDNTWILPWQTWPHVRKGSGQNEIQIDRAGREITVRVNRELLWRGVWSAGASRIGIYGESFGADTVVNYHELARYGP